MARQIKLYTNATHENAPAEPAEAGDAREDAEGRTAAPGHGSGAHEADAEPAFIPLSSRQHEILQYIIEGHQNKTIADLLGIELVTVKMHVGMLFKKLGVTNRTMAAVRGVELLSDAGSRHHGRRHRGAPARACAADYALPARVRAALLDRS
ncbi:helix-turn-helix domain-containing protein [Achromobacter pulmonis]|uniref:helix-turn-helix domain-containing protein n=1 Tax=Achromobacter pulmonis TaxID=1389932 RepID=UPI001F223988